MNPKESNKLACIEYMPCAKIFKYIFSFNFWHNIKNKWDYTRLTNDKVGIKKIVSNILSLLD